MTDSDNIKLKAYEQLCESYRAIDDFRAKLLALLPIATGGGIFLLIGGKTKGVDIGLSYLPEIGLFGFVVTLGLFFFELHGILKCTRLIGAGANLEEALGINKKEGQFIDRPLGIMNFINEPFAAGIVYPAVLAAWVYLGTDFNLIWAACVFIAGFVVGVIYNISLVLPAYYARKCARKNEKPMV